MTAIHENYKFIINDAGSGVETFFK